MSGKELTLSEKKNKKLDEIAELAQDTDKYVLDEKGNVKIDEDTQLPIFKDAILLKVTPYDLNGMVLCLQDLLTDKVIPPNEVGAVFDLMENLAKQETNERKFSISLPVNYCAGLWHCLNLAKDLDIYSKNQKSKVWLKETTHRVAEFLDVYHSLKKKSDIIDKGLPVPNRGFVPKEAENKVLEFKKE